MENNSQELMNSPKEKNISIPELSLPKGGGAMKGIGETFQPDPYSGTGNLAIPIYTSPCRNFEPKINLNYNSGSGNGIFGIGFSISLPVISRRTSKGIPRYDESDTFLFTNSEELVPKLSKKGEQWTNEVSRLEENGVDWEITSYIPTIEGIFSKIEFWKNSRESYWKVVSKENITSIFGQTENARVADPDDSTRIFQWLIEKTFDAKGNKVEYRYKQENSDNVPGEIYEENRNYKANRYIQSIRYGNYFNARGQEAWALEAVFDYGEYDISDKYLANPDCNPYVPSGKWLSRQDPFSSYRSGFEIRTRRLCRNVLMFHHLEKELGANPYLVKATRLTYAESEVMSQLTAVELKGFQREDNGSYGSKSMPSLEFTYSSLNPVGHEYKNLIVEDGKSIPGYLGKSQFNLVDLYGDGIPGFLYSDDKTALYWKPKGEGKYGYPESPLRFPIEKDLNQAEYSLVSLEGNGRLDLVVAGPQRGGFYESNPAGSWQCYRDFISYPLDITNPQKELVDIEGHGLADILVFEEKTLRYYPSLKKEGYGPPVRKDLTIDEAGAFPTTGNLSAAEVTGFADLFGDGLSHRVRVRNGMVECWPNMGYGRFGRRVLFGNAPQFGETMDASRVFFADIDGSGTADIVYLQTDRVDVYLNQSGNGFRGPISIPLPGVYAQLDQITFADVEGNGATCLVYTRMGSEVNHYYYDFTGGLKPYLLMEINNNLGAVSRINYASSVKFYLEDKRRGGEWKTKLPFPVQVVDKVESIDQVSGSKIVNRFSYHDGYYDYWEKEFRGFGFVEEWDTEDYNSFANPGLLKDLAFEAVEEELHVPPVYTKRWYHTGAYIEAGVLSKQYQKEYYDKDPQAYKMPDSTFDPAISKSDFETIRQAYIALKGHLLREEVYALDNESGLSGNPYAVTETNFQVREIQPRTRDRYASFYVHEKETISCHYERNPADPRVEHGFVMAVDLFGNVTKSCHVFYPRRSPDNGPTGSGPVIYPEQSVIRATAEINSFLNSTDDFWLIGIPSEHRSFEIGGLDLQGQSYFSFAEIAGYEADGHWHDGQVEIALKNQISFEQKLTVGKKQARLLEWKQDYYWNKAQDDCLPKGEITELALLHHSEKAVFSDGLINLAFNGKVTADMLEKDGGYAHRDGYWWNRGIVVHYYHASEQRFYLPYQYENTYAPDTSPLHGKTVFGYDEYCLAQISKTVFLAGGNKNVSTALLDYSVLQPKQIIDINGVTSQILFDPLGIVIATSIFGTADGKPEGDMDLNRYRVVPDASFDDVLDDGLNQGGKKYLQGATAFFYYNLSFDAAKKQPAGFINLVREKHVSQLGKDEKPGIQVHINYADGFSRETEKKLKVDQGWLVSGRTVYNNKAKPVKQYLPYFSSTPYYEDQKEMEAVLLDPTVITYDPLLRVIRTDTPKGFFKKAEFTPWEIISFDEDDTVKESVYYINFMKNYPPNPTQEQKDEKDSLDKAASFDNTPDIKVLDNTGQTFLDIRNNPDEVSMENYLTTYYELDIEGNVLTSIDPRLYDSNIKQKTAYFNFKTIYDMQKNPVSVTGADAGSRLTLMNIFGKPVYEWDGRGFQKTVLYDTLQRPVEIKVKGDDGRGLVLDQTVEKIVYGEDCPDPAGKNLRGQIYRHSDQAGITIFPKYNIDAKAVETSRQLRKDYKQEVNWDNPVALEDEIFTATVQYDALGRIISEKTGDGSLANYTYNQAALLRSLEITFNGGSRQAFVTDIQYNENNQRISIAYGNGVTTNYTYEKSTQRLTGILTKRPDTDSKGAGRNPTIQNIVYIYDPAGNITRVRDYSYQTVFCRQQVVEPLSDYTYNALYQLINATGRQHPGILADTHQSGFKQSIFMPFCPPDPNDMEKLENYQELYKYDKSGNLTTIRHCAKSAAWTQETEMKPDSNRTTRITAQNGIPKIYKTEYDQNGNILGLENLSAIKWNYRNNITRVDIIPRKDEISDSDYYTYDSAGQRVRKVSERKISDTITEIEEKIYLGRLEIKRVKRVVSGSETTILDRQTLHVMDDKKRVALAYYWIKDDHRLQTGQPGARKFRFQLDNNLHSSCVEVDEGANLISYEEYFPYGGTSVIAGNSESEVNIKEYRYCGKERDDTTGLYYYGARYYASWLGRWMSPDPAGPVDGLNLYAFVGGNPLSFADRQGMMKANVENLGQHEMGKIIPRALEDNHALINAAQAQLRNPENVRAVLQGWLGDELTERNFDAAVAQLSEYVDRLAGLYNQGRNRDYKWGFLGIGGLFSYLWDAVSGNLENEEVFLGSTEAKGTDLMSVYRFLGEAAPVTVYTSNWDQIIQSNQDQQAALQLFVSHTIIHEQFHKYAGAGDIAYIDRQYSNSQVRYRPPDDRQGDVIINVSGLPTLLNNADTLAGIVVQLGMIGLNRGVEYENYRGLLNMAFNRGALNDLFRKGNQLLEFFGFV